MTTATIELNQICETDNGISTVPLVEERAFGLWQGDIPAGYRGLGARELTERIHAARRALGTRAVVLGHHYQREDIIAFADFRGDSFKLSPWAAE
jgi:quinolinate synthase